MPDHIEVEDYINRLLEKGLRPVMYRCDPEKHRYCRNSIWCIARGGDCSHTVQEEFAMRDENGNPIIEDAEGRSK